jgi:hypothetical protein
MAPTSMARIPTCWAKPSERFSASTKAVIQASVPERFGGPRAARVELLARRSVEVLWLGRPANSLSALRGLRSPNSREPFARLVAWPRKSVPHLSGQSGQPVASTNHSAPCDHSRTPHGRAHSRPSLVMSQPLSGVLVKGFHVPLGGILQR